jgi:putative heme transporter
VAPIARRAVVWARRRTRVLGGLLGAGVVAVVFLVVLPRIADYRDVWEVVRDLSWWWLLALLCAAVLNLVTFAPATMSVLPGIGFRAALALSLASTASTYIAPGGAAVGVALSYAMLRGWGFGGAEVTAALTLIGVWSQLVVFGFPAIALAALTASGGASPSLQTAALLGSIAFALLLGVFMLALTSARRARQIGDIAARVAAASLRVFGRRPVTWTGESLARFRGRAIGLLRRRWHVLTLSTLVAHLTVYLVLVVALLAVGVDLSEVSLIESFAAWSLVRLLGSIPITPGGVGFVELGLTGALVAFGAGQPEAVAATLLYRVLTVVPPLVLGLAAGATWRRHQPRLASDPPPPSSLPR